MPPIRISTHFLPFHPFPKGSAIEFAKPRYANHLRSSGRPASLEKSEKGSASRLLSVSSDLDFRLSTFDRPLTPEP